MNAEWGEGKEGADGKVLVRMEKVLAGRSPRTKYFISICPTEPSMDQEAEAKRPEPQPGGGFLIQTHTSRGSSDRIRPYVPTPGDVRRMFGNDKIDGKPEYVSSIDPDWSSYTPESMHEVERRIRMWNEATCEAEKAFEVLTVTGSKEALSNEEYFSDCSSPKPSLEEEQTPERISQKKETFQVKDDQTERGNFNESGILSNPAEGRKPKNKDRKVVIIEPSENVMTHSQKERIIKLKDKTEENIMSKSENTCCNKIPARNGYKPKTGLSRKAYDTAVSIVKRMSKQHWKIVDSLYTTLKTEQCINFKHLCEQITKIVKEIYGTKSYKYIMSSIDKDYATCIIKLSKVLLNLYQEATYESQVKGGKFVSLYNRSPKVKKAKPSKIKSTEYNKLIQSQKRPRRCEACLAKCLNSRKNQPPLKKKKNNIPSLPKSRKPYLRCDKIPISMKKETKTVDNVTSVSLTEKSPSETQVPLQSDRRKFKLNAQRVVKTNVDRPYSSPADLGSSSSSNCSKDDAEIGKFSNGNERSFAANDRDKQLVMKSQSGNQLPDKKYLLNLENSLFTLFSSSDDSASLCDALKANLEQFDPNEYSREYFKTTLNLFWLNEKLENSLGEPEYLEEKEIEPSEYADCESSFEDSEIIPHIKIIEKKDRNNVHITKENVVLRNTAFRKRFLSMANECKINRNYISIFISILFGVAAAYFSKDQDFSKEKLTLKHTLKVYLRSLLVGALRLVNDF